MTNPFDWKMTQGWLSEDEGAALQSLARGKRVLELGALFGRSTLCMAAVADLVVSVDWHHGDRHAGYQDTLSGYLLGVHGLNNVVPVVCRFEKVESFLAHNSFDMVFVDGQHDFKSVMRDTRIAVNMVKTEGVIAWHDYSAEFPDVFRAIEESFIDHEISALVGTLAWRRIYERDAAAVSSAPEQLAGGLAGGDRGGGRG